MAICLVQDFPGVTEQQYDDGVALLRQSGPVPPPGQVVHVVGTVGDGLRVIDVWESVDAFLDYLDARFRAVMDQVGLPQPRVQRFDVHSCLLGR